MNKRKRIGDRTDPCGTLLFIGVGEKQLPATTAEIERLEKKQ